MNATVTVPAPETGTLLIDARAASAALSISPRKLWTLTNAGEVPHVKIGRRILYSPDALRAYIEAQSFRGSQRTAS
jgi:hypothetical protein